MRAPQPHLTKTPPGATAGIRGKWARGALLSALYCTVAGGHAVVERFFANDLGPSALASLQASSTLAYATLALVAALGMARLVKPRGATDAREAAQTLRAIRMALVLGAILGGLTYALAPTLIPAFIGNGDPEGRREALSYLAVLIWAAPVAGVYHVSTAALQARGDMRGPAASAALSIAVTVAAGLGFGIDDCGDIARATLLGLGCGSLVVVYRLTLPWPPLRHILAEHRQLDSGSFRRWEAPLLVERAATIVAFLAFGTLAHRLNIRDLAQHQLLVGLDSVGFHVGEGLAIAAAAVAVRYRGLSHASLRHAIVATLVIGGLFGVAMLVFGVGVGVPLRVVLVAGLLQPWMMASMVLAMLLRARGRTRGVASVAVLGGLLIRLPMGYWLVERCGLGLEGLWLASGADHLAQLGALVVLWRDHGQVHPTADISSDRHPGPAPLDVSPALS